MARAPTTRMGLLASRSSRSIVERGARLLRSKRQVLADELFAALRAVMDGRAQLDEVLREAARALTIARAADSEEALASLALAAAREIPIVVDRRTVWGVPVPQIAAPALVRAADARGAAVTGWSLSALEAARLHERALEILLGNASRELVLERLGEEIRETSRRINGLEHVVLPRLRREIARISFALDERAREDVVRLKRLRGHRPPRGRP